MYLALLTIFFVTLLLLVLRLNRRGEYGASHLFCLLAVIATTGAYFALILRYDDSWDSFMALMDVLVGHWS